MDYASYVDQIDTQNDALLAAVTEAGPHAPVPTCPEWTVDRLVAHVAGFHGLALTAMDTEPGPERPKVPTPPSTDWDELLAWWADAHANLLAKLNDTDPEQPCWALHGAGNVAFWARRGAHELGIHRLDAEQARLGDDEPIGLLYNSDFAADGVDEYLTGILPLILTRKPDQAQTEGSVLWHAADAGRIWRIEVRPGHYDVREHPHTDGLAETMTVAGSADSLYRLAWGRPSTAVITGDPSVLAALRAI